MPSRIRPAAALACVLASCAAAPAQPTPRFYDLTQGSPYSINGAAAISRDGTVAGDLGFLPDGQYGYLWNAEEGIHALTPPTPTAISADGTTTVGSTVVGAYVWRLGQGHTILPRPSGYDMPEPQAVSGDGSVVVGAVEASDPHAVGRRGPPRRRVASLPPPPSRRRAAPLIPVRPGSADPAPLKIVLRRPSRSPRRTERASR